MAGVMPVINCVEGLCRYIIMLRLSCGHKVVDSSLRFRISREDLPAHRLLLALDPGRGTRAAVHVEAIHVDEGR